MKEYPHIFYPTTVAVDKNLIDFKNYKTGFSESFFEHKLERYFKNHILKNVVIDDGRKYPYQPDYIFYYEEYNLYIDIEIDEPYALSNKKPIHLNDDKRNDYFLDKGWGVIRFAEIQVTKYPELCCKIISEYIRNITDENIWIEGFHELKSLETIAAWNFDDANEMASKSYRQTYLQFLKKIDEKHPSVSIIADGIYLNQQILETKVVLAEVEEIERFNESAKISVFLKLLLPSIGHFKLSENENDKVYIELTIYISRYHSFYSFSFDSDFIEIGRFVFNIYYVRTQEIICFEIFEKIIDESLKQVILIADDPAYPPFLDDKNRNEFILVRNYYDTFMPGDFSYINIDGPIEHSLEIVYKNE
ncbi:hypothetical protein FMM05_08590 [Flavobacterium zepuense]|uniref:Uncharacterized protein n=1 Tax=Flavobacterium zepuense TaxID=2593302 RepID=A0A552V4I5_9FLAO|nr:hypothetical protein [Flavobacterium zepuense]TRW25351.1 hypothetical protein FMM05_08590 [Flavobacterium zepuense]